MNRIGWGIISSANIARKALIPAIAAASNAELICLGTAHPDRVAENRQRYGYEVLSDYEAVLRDPRVRVIYNPLPNGMHREWTLRALRAGKHVLCEKPFTVLPTEAREVADAADAAGLYVMEAFMYRFHPQMALAKQLLDSGRIGVLRLIRSAFTFNLPPDPANPRYQRDQGPGALMDVGCYCVNASRYFSDGPPVSVLATDRRHSATDADLSTSALLEYPSHTALFDCSFESSYRTELEIVGDQGRILLPKPWLPGVQPATVLVSDSRGLEELQTEGVDQYRLMVEHFSASVAEGRPPARDADDATENMGVLEAIRRSAADGRRVMLSEVSA